MNAVVVYVHGLWLSGREALFLRRRLAHEFDFDVRTFRYPAVSGSMVEIAEQLQTFVAEIRPQALHLVGHSLGGLVIYRFLERFPEQPPGRVVFLGTPAVASRAAVSAARMRWAASLIGNCVAEELLVERERSWRLSRELGVIAGTHALGLGQLFADFHEDNDGTIAVSETRLPGLTDHIALPTSHMGMLLSARVAHETGTFLRQGRFALPPH
jgi:pimeloyl-ACP methyl ester carboxylesterase